MRIRQVTAGVSWTEQTRTQPQQFSPWPAKEGRLCFHKPALHKAIVVLRVCSRIFKISNRSVIHRIIRRRLEPAQHMLSEQGEPVTYTEEDQWNLKA
jgi:hypothetical protein